jgi:beta-lactamase class A
MMDFKERREGEENYTTAGDMAYLLEELYYRKFLNKEVSEKCLKLLGEQKINDRIPRKLPRGTYVVHKTGLEKHVCHDVGIVFTNKGNFLICVLAKHEDRFARHTKKFISDVTLLTYNYYKDL